MREVRPGDVYRLNYEFEERGGFQYRPAIILQVQDNVAVAIKVTHSGPTPHYPHRYKIDNISGSGLDDNSHTQYDWYNTYVVPFEEQHDYMGTLDTIEFLKIATLFKQQQIVKRLLSSISTNSSR